MTDEEDVQTVEEYIRATLLEQRQKLDEVFVEVALYGGGIVFGPGFDIRRDPDMPFMVTRTIKEEE